jgi:hypothetical protein
MREKAFPMMGSINEKREPGMDLRDRFAGQALAGVMADSTRTSNYGEAAYSSIEVAKQTAQWVYMLADAMMEARKQEASE